MPDQGAKRRAAAELAERGAAVFEPVGGAPGVDLAVRAGAGQYVEVIVKEPASPGNGRAFAMRRFRPRPHLFILCVTADGEAWPLPPRVRAIRGGRARRDRIRRGGGRCAGLEVLAAL